jgi:hypothetical protein
MTENVVQVGNSHQKMLKNVDFKKIYEDPVSGITPRRFVELSIEEEANI